MSEPCSPGTLFTVGDPEDFQIYPEGPFARVRRVEHEWFGTLLAPVAPSDISTLVGWVAAAWGTAGWRGQASLCWPFDSSLTRRVKARDASLGWVLGAGPPLDRVVRETELRLLGRARLAGHDRRDGRTLSDLELSAVLQHHGAATRLLDCTFNAYVSLWFACRDHPDEWGVIAGFDLARAWPVLTAEQRDLPMQDLLRILEQNARFGVWGPAALSPRISAQQGFFVFSVVVDEIWGSLRFRGDQLHETGSIPGLNLFAVSPELKAQFGMVWEEQFGYTEESMFPDLDGFARVHGAAYPFPANFYDGPSLLP